MQHHYLYCCMLVTRQCFCLLCQAGHAFGSGDGPECLGNHARVVSSLFHAGSQIRGHVLYLAEIVRRVEVSKCECRLFLNPSTLPSHDGSPGNRSRRHIRVGDDGLRQFCDTTSPPARQISSDRLSAIARDCAASSECLAKVRYAVYRAETIRERR